jgi:prevent-host-death family protein
MTTISSRDFNQDVTRAKRAAKNGPVVITDRGEPAWVLLRHEEWKRLTGEGPNLAQLLSMPEAEEIDIEFEPARIELKPAALD